MICGAGPLPFLTDDDLDVDAHPEYGYCCYGAAGDGDPRFCTCWRAVYTLDQAAVGLGATPTTRVTMCDDCAFRPGSPERTEGSDEYLEGLLDLPNFWCHQGTRAVVEWHHPDGRVRQGNPTQDYRPPIFDGIPYKANGDPADRCAGHAAHQRELTR